MAILGLFRSRSSTSSLLQCGSSSLFRVSPPHTPAFILGGRRLGFCTDTSSYDVVVLGGGPGGYVAAIKAGQLGLKTACVEGRGALGGTCLNVGCIPSKALLNATHKYHELLHEFPKLGIEVKGEINFNVEGMLNRKNEIVKGLTGGIEMLFKRHNISYIKGWGKIKDATTVEVQPVDGSLTQLTAKNIIIATGSEAAPMPGGVLTADEKVVVTSTGALNLQKVPKKMVIVGGGVIGLELGSVWSRLGAEVEVVEFLDRICPALDGEICKALQKSLKKQGMSFRLSTKVVGADIQEDKAIVHIEGVGNGTKESIEADIVLLAVGRIPVTKNIGLENIGISTDKGGRIPVGEGFLVPGHPTIRAIGDVVSGPMLAHKAEDEGIAAVEALVGSASAHSENSFIPSVVYTHPELAGVGSTEEELKKANVAYTKGSFPFAANSRGRINNETEGMVKILADKSSDKILGAWILGPSAGELIAEVVLAMEYGASSEDIGRTCHAHPTVSEAVKEACMMTYSKAIHFA